MHCKGHAYSKKPLHVPAKEFTRATEIELNELLKRFVVRQAKRRDGQRPQGRAGVPQQPVMAAGRKTGVEIGRNAGSPLFFF